MTARTIREMLESGKHGSRESWCARMTPSPLRRNAASPAFYEIVIEGQLDSFWSSRLGGMVVCSRTTGDSTFTVLHGVLPDQAALLGVLTTLCSIGHPIKSVSQQSGQKTRPQ